MAKPSRPRDLRGPAPQGRAGHPARVRGEGPRLWFSSKEKQTPCGKPRGLFQEASLCPPRQDLPPTHTPEAFPPQAGGFSPSPPWHRLRGWFHRRTPRPLPGLQPSRLPGGCPEWPGRTASAHGLRAPTPVGSRSGPPPSQAPQVGRPVTVPQRPARGHGARRSRSLRPPRTASSRSPAREMI